MTIPEYPYLINAQNYNSSNPFLGNAGQLGQSNVSGLGFALQQVQQLQQQQFQPVLVSKYVVKRSWDYSRDAEEVMYNTGEIEYITKLRSFGGQVEREIKLEAWLDSELDRIRIRLN